MAEGNQDIWSITFGPSADEDAPKVVQLTTSTADDIGQDGHMGIMKRLYGSSSGAFRVQRTDYPGADSRFLISANTTPAGPVTYGSYNPGDQFGDAVRFTPPTTPYVIDKIHVYGFLSGTQVADAAFDLSVLADDRTSLYKGRYRREDFFSSNAAWATIDIPDLSVSGPVYLVVSTPIWSRGGLQVCFGSHDAAYSSVLLSRIQDLWKLNLDGSGKEQLTNDPSYNGGGKFDRSGTRIAFVSDRGSASLDIWKMNADGSGMVSLATSSADEVGPAWSPDGSEIVYQSSGQLWKMNADGSGQSQLTTEGSSWGATYTPDGAKILFSGSRFAGLDVWSMNPDGSGQVRLTTDPATDESPKPSSDGTKVLFESLRNGRSDIYVVNIDGTGEARLTSDPGVDTMPSWGPDGQHINFVSDRKGGSDLWVMNVDGSGQTQLTTNLSEDSQTGWRWDGVRMGFASRRNGNWDLYVYKYLNEDTTSPATVLSASPVAPDGSSGWYRSAPSVTLTSDEPGSTRYCWDSNPAPGDPAWTLYSASIAAAEGSHTLHYYSTDSAGNTETVHSQAFKVDTIAPPAPVLDRPYDLSTTNNSTPRLKWGAGSDSGSGLAGYDAILDGSVASGGLVQTTTTVSLTTGPHTWAVRATDLAGNQAASPSRTLTMATPPTAFPWRRVVSQGFGQPANVFPLSMASFGGRLYLSTENSQQGGQTWSSADGLTWTQAAPSGFGTTANTAVGGLAVFGGYLYAGTYNATGGCQVWRTSDGTNWGRVATGGFGDSANRNLRRLLVFGSHLYAGTRNNATGGEVWRTADGTNWTQVNTDGFGDANNIDAWNSSVFNGSLYFGTVNLVTGAEVWRTSDGTSWQQTNADGFGDGTNKQVLGFSELGGNLYAGTGAHTGVETCTPIGGADVWRSPDGSNWTLVTGNGFGDAYNCVSPSGATQGSHMYVPMRDDSNGAGIWRTMNGSAFQRVNADGFGNSANVGAPWMEVFQDRLYVGAINYQDGLEVWRIEDTSAPTAPSTLSWTGLTTSTVTLSWSASTDVVGVTGYRLCDGSTGSTLVTTTATTATRTGLTPGSTCSFFVKAFDAAGNVSPASATLSVHLPNDVVSQPTDPGSNVATSAPVELPSGQNATVTVAFSEVTTAGMLNIAATDQPPQDSPSGFVLAGTYFDISFDGGFTGPVTITLPYDPSIPDAQAQNLRLFHWTNDAWEDVTVSVDTVNHTVTGRASSLSPFGMGWPWSATGANTWALIALGLGLLGLGRLSWGHEHRGGDKDFDRAA
jgi:TolB protein